MKFPIYGRTNGDDLVKIISPTEFILLTRTIEERENDNETFFVASTRTNIKGNNSQYFMAHLSGGLKESSEAEFEELLLLNMEKISAE